jgi:AsmA protein
VDDNDEAREMHRAPPDLSQIRPSADLDPPARSPRAGTRAPRRAVPPRRRRSSGRALLGRIGVGLAVVAGVVIVAASAFFYVVSPTELVREQLIRQIQANTGRTLAINGAARFMLYPSIGVSLGDVTLSEPPEMGAKNMLQARRIDVSVALMPLFSREVHVEQIAVVEPTIELRIDESGRENWSFALFDRPARYAAAGSLAGAGSVLSDHSGGLVVRTAAPAQAGGLPSAIQQIELRSIALTKARIRYHDARSGVAHSVDDFNLRLSGRRLSDPMRATGDLSWRGETVRFDVRLDAPRALMGDNAAKARLTLAGAPLAAGFDGTVKLRPAFEARGAVRFDGHSLAAAAEFLGTHLPNGGPLGGFRGTGELVAKDKSVALNQASLVMGQTRMTGIIFAEQRKARPYISADLKITDLDIDSLSAGFAEAAPVTRSGPTSALITQAGTRLPAAGVTVSGDDGAPQSIEDLLKRYPVPRQEPGVAKFAPQVRGYRSRDGWSDAPLNADALGAIDAKARLKIDRLKVASLDIARGVTRLTLNDRKLDVTIDDLSLYGGGGKGIVTAGPAGQGLKVGGNLTLDKVAIQPLLKDASGLDTLAGQGNIQLSVSGAGSSQQAIAETLAGRAQVTLENGAIVGWNLAKILRGLGRGEFSGLDAVESETTDFSELAATFRIANGNAVTDDLRLISPLLRVAGKGRIGIGQRDLDLALKPKLVSSLTGQGGEMSAAGLEIPVRLKGPWRTPRVVSDFNSLARNPNQIIEKARELGQALKRGNFSDIVRGALGNQRREEARDRDGTAPAKGAAGSGGAPHKGGAQDLIKRFLR